MPSFIQNIKYHFAQKRIEKQADQIFKQAKNDAKEYRRLFGCLPFRYCTGVNQGVLRTNVVRALRFEDVPTEVKQLLAVRLAKKEDSRQLDRAHSVYESSVKTLSETLSQVSAIEGQLASAQKKQAALQAGEVTHSVDPTGYSLLRKKEDIASNQAKIQIKERALDDLQKNLEELEQKQSLDPRGRTLCDGYRETIYLYKRQIFDLKNQIKCDEADIANLEALSPEANKEARKKLEFAEVAHAIHGSELTLKSLKAKIDLQYAFMHEACKQVEQELPVEGPTSAILLRYLPVKIGEARHDSLWKGFALPRHSDVKDLSVSAELSRTPTPEQN